MNNKQLSHLAREIRNIPVDKVLLVVTGAGVSLASGIPTFRGSDKGAVWAKDVMELGTFAFFKRQPAGSWSWYLERFDTLRHKQPNPAHHALVELEKWTESKSGKFLLVTQNVDCLHEAAGSRQLVKVHGSADRVRCTSVGNCKLAAPEGFIQRDQVDLSEFLKDPVDSNVPKCPSCGSLLRQHVLWFDEYYDEHADYQIRRVKRTAEKAGVTLFVGTSFSVGITEMIVSRAVSFGSKLFSIDPAGDRPHSALTPICLPAEEALPQLVSLLN
jgi:NAD-dependent deacetylase